MTPKEAIETIKIATAEVEWNYPINYAAAFEVAIEALEKQMPKKYEIWNGQCCCPNCNVMFGNYDDLKLLKSWKMDYCKFCGQTIDWSDGERTGHNE